MPTNVGISKQKLKILAKMSMIVVILHKLVKFLAIIPTFVDILMKHSIQSVEDIGLVIRAVRKSSHVRQDDLASTVNVSRQFTIDVERGKPTVQFGRVLLLLKELGVSLSVDIPDEALKTLMQLQARRNDKASGAAGSPASDATRSSS